MSASNNLCTAFGEGAVKEKTALNWFQKFCSGNETLEGKHQAPAWLLSLNDDNLKATTESDLWLTCHELWGLMLSVETIRLYLHLLETWWKISRWVPYELTHLSR